MTSSQNSNAKQAGRPKSPSVRDYNLNVRLTSDEQTRLKKAADKAGLTLAALVRLRALESIDDDKDDSTAMTA